MVAIAAIAVVAPKRPKALKVCNICGTDITLRGRRAYMCEICAKHQEIAAKAQRYLKYGIERAKRTRKRQRVRGIEYEHQYHSGDGTAYIITNQGRLTHRIEKICKGCHKTDEEVRGWWAPIFSSFDSQGNELEPVLLCLVCYRASCDKYNELEKQYA